MFRQDMKESHTKKCTIENFEDETVIHFFQYLYSDCLQNQHAIELIRSVGDLPQLPMWKKIKKFQLEIDVAKHSEKHVFKRTDFEREKFTVELLIMADYYQVEDLKLDCMEYLKESVKDENVLDVWLDAEKYVNKELSEMAIDHLVERAQTKPLEEVPGFTEALGSLETAPKDLLSRLYGKVVDLRKESRELACLRREKEDWIKGGDLKITVKQGDDYSDVFLVNRTDTVSNLYRDIAFRRARHPKGQPMPRGKTHALFKDPINRHKSSRLSATKTFGDYSICACKNNTALYLDYVPHNY